MGFFSRFKLVLKDIDVVDDANLDEDAIKKIKEGAVKDVVDDVKQKVTDEKDLIALDQVEDPDQEVTIMDPNSAARYRLNDKGVFEKDDPLLGLKQEINTIQNKIGSGDNMVFSFDTFGYQLFATFSIKNPLKNQGQDARGQVFYYNFNEKLLDMNLISVVFETIMADGTVYRRIYSVKGKISEGIKSDVYKDFSTGARAWTGCMLNMIVNKDVDAVKGFSYSKCATGNCCTPNKMGDYYFAIHDYVGCTDQDGMRMAYAQCDGNCRFEWELNHIGKPEYVNIYVRINAEQYTNYNYTKVMAAHGYGSDSVWRKTSDILDVASETITGGNTGATERYYGAQATNNSLGNIYAYAGRNVNCTKWKTATNTPTEIDYRTSGDYRNQNNAVASDKFGFSIIANRYDDSHRSGNMHIHATDTIQASPFGTPNSRAYSGGWGNNQEKGYMTYSTNDRVDKIDMTTKTKINAAYNLGTRDHDQATTSYGDRQLLETDNNSNANHRVHTLSTDSFTGTFKSPRHTGEGTMSGTYDKGYTLGGYSNSEGGNYHQNPYSTRVMYGVNAFTVIASVRAKRSSGVAGSY